MGSVKLKSSPAPMPGPASGRTASAGVLDIPPIMSPVDAVRAAIVAEARAKPNG